jgi:cobalt/nickel transport system permease protein
MHISEGIITGAPAAAYAAAGLTLMGLGTWRMKKFAARFPDKKPLIGMGGALIFFVSLIPLPAFTGTCSHPCGTPLIAILLGPSIAIALAGIALLLQAAFFAHGGFSTWGANVLTLGLMASLGGWLTFRGARKLGLPLWLAGGAAGLVGDILTYAAAGLILSVALVHAPTPQYSLKGYLAAIYAAYLPTQLPIALGEMALTGLALQYVFRQRPEVLEELGVVDRRMTRPSLGMTGLCLIFCTLTLLALGVPAVADSKGLEAANPPAAAESTAAAKEEPKSGFKGMDEAVNEHMSEAAGLKAHEPYINLEGQGDVWNAVLLIGGGTAGFIMGRWWHLLFGGKKPSTLSTDQQAGTTS